MIYTPENCTNANVYELVWRDEKPTLELCKKYVYSVDTDSNTVEYYATEATLIREKAKTLRVLELPDSSFIFVVEFLEV